MINRFSHNRTPVNPDISQEFWFWTVLSSRCGVLGRKCPHRIVQIRLAGLFDLRPCIGPKFLIQNTAQSGRIVNPFVRYGVNGSCADASKPCEITGLSSLRFHYGGIGWKVKEKHFKSWARSSVRLGRMFNLFYILGRGIEQNALSLSCYF
jgi:hypothetical protein